MRNGITYEDVERAILAFQKKGVLPTIERIRHFLGTGSASTINKFVNKYKENIQDNPKKKSKLYRQGYQDAVYDILNSIKKFRDY